MPSLPCFEITPLKLKPGSLVFKISLLFFFLIFQKRYKVFFFSFSPAASAEFPLRFNTAKKKRGLHFVPTWKLMKSL
jgi:hypothetical protein